MVPRLSRQRRFSTIIFICIAVYGVFGQAYGQQISKQEIWSKLQIIENAKDDGLLVKVNKLVKLKKQFEDQRLEQDSVYARILDRMGVYEYILNDNILNESIIKLTLQAIKINTSGRRGSSLAYGIISTTNLGFFYEQQKVYVKALEYYDSTISLGTRFSFNRDVMDSRYSKGKIFISLGDYSNAIKEDVIALSEIKGVNNKRFISAFLNQKSQAHFFLNQYEMAKGDADSAFAYATIASDTFEIASALKNQAFALSKSLNSRSAKLLFEKTIFLRLLTKNNQQVGRDYADLGNYFLEVEKNYNKATKSYLKALEFANKVGDGMEKGIALANLAASSLLQDNYEEAARLNRLALAALHIYSGNPFFSNPNAAALNLVGNKELVLVTLVNKTSLLLNLFKVKRDVKYLDACLSTALLTDTLISNIRHQQLGEQSKLYWRDRTRTFFAKAIEASYLASDTRLTFFFMEKSRAVLLNDRLNELNASTRLPNKEAQIEQELKAKLFHEQQILASLRTNSQEYYAQQVKVSEQTNLFEQYIRLLESKYPVYYQYKYNDRVPILEDLQKHLAKTQKTFVHYFMSDSATYILKISPNSTKIFRLPISRVNEKDISDFLQLCSDEQKFQRNSNAFDFLSYKIFRGLFQPLEIPPGPVVICTDNFLIPFEALSSDSHGSNFLVFDYAFSYVYSASFLLRNLNSYRATGNFIGFAPILFNPSLGVSNLKLSGEALEKSSKYYYHGLLLTGDNASKRNFIKQINQYKIVNVFSHASADTTDREPVLFMQDSAIALSELQIMRGSGTQLIILSACQTNVGKNAKGEGIYSLARGFVAAGVPSVAATLWKAEEQTIYIISDKFHKNLSSGMSKDRALQRAKNDYLKEDRDMTKMSPYLWANLVLIGDVEPLQLTESDGLKWYWIVVVAAIIILGFFFLKNKLRRGGV
jgi:CHAT domain-containing protein/tetratricopeptide (TPR) repeat protein